MTRLTLPKNHAQPDRKGEPDVLPVDPDKGPMPDLLTDDQSRDGVSDPAAQKESDHATA